MLRKEENAKGTLTVEKVIFAVQGLATVERDLVTVNQLMDACYKVWTSLEETCLKRKVVRESVLRKVT